MARKDCLDSRNGLRAQSGRKVPAYTLIEELGGHDVWKRTSHFDSATSMQVIGRTASGMDGTCGQTVTQNHRLELEIKLIKSYQQSVPAFRQRERPLLFRLCE
jgi:hypothetical protein